MFYLVVPLDKDEPPYMRPADEIAGTDWPPPHCRIFFIEQEERPTICEGESDDTFEEVEMKFS